LITDGLRSRTAEYFNRINCLCRRQSYLCCGGGAKNIEKVKYRIMTKTMRFLSLCIAVFGAIASVQAKTIFVNGANSTPGNGLSWGTAVLDIQSALDVAASGDQIWIAKGEYNTPLNAEGDGRDPYSLDKSLSFYGGFAGTETALDQRNIEQDSTVLVSYLGDAYFDLFVVLSGSITVLFHDMVMRQVLGTFDFDLVAESSRFEFYNVTHERITGIANDIKCGDLVIVYEGCKFLHLDSPFFMDEYRPTLSTIVVSRCEIIDCRQFINVSNVDLQLQNTFATSDVSIGLFIDVRGGNVLIDRCRFIDFADVARILDVGSSADYDIDVTISDSEFRNISGGYNLFEITSSLLNAHGLLFDSVESDYLFYLYVDGEIKIDGCEIMNNQFGATPIYIGQGNCSTITDCYFFNNEGSGQAGAISLGGNHCIVENCQFVENSSTYGCGAVFNYSCRVIELNDCLFNANTGKSSGAIYSTNSFVDIAISRCHFIKNKGNNDGAVFLLSNSSVKDCLFRGNTSLSDGSAMRGDDLICENSIFEDHILGESLLYTTGTAYFSNCIIRNNRGVSCLHMKPVGSLSVSSTLYYGNVVESGLFYHVNSVLNCAFFNNSAKNLIPSNGEVSNSIFWNNEGTYHGYATFSHCNLDETVEGNGNMNVDPEFVDPENGDFRLSCTSPLINKGSNEYVTEGMTDLDGNPRIFAGQVDMGAYEAQVDPAYTGIPQVDFSVSTDEPCRTELVQFTNTTAHTDNYRYTWQFGDTTGQVYDVNPSHFYQYSGGRTVSLYATNICGKSASITKDLTVQDSYVASIYYPTTVHADATTSFTTNASCGSLQWNVTEGNILSGQGTDSIAVQWNDGSNGAGSVTLVATDCGTEMCELPIVADVPIFPDTIAITGHDRVCLSSIEDYSATYNSAANSSYYSWIVEGGSLLGTAEGYGIATIAVQWPKSQADAQVFLQVFNEVLDTTIYDTLAVRIRQPLAIKKDTVGCFANTETFSLTLWGTYNVQWSATGSNTVDPATGEITWASVAGIDTVQVVSLDEDNFCNDTAWQVVHVYDYPTVNNVIGPDEIYTGKTYTYSAELSEHSDPIWTATGGSIIAKTGNEATLQWYGAAPYSLSVIAKRGGECKSDAFVFPIVSDAQFAIDGPDTLCYGSTEIFSATTTATDAVGYEWEYRGQALGSGISKEITFLRDGRNVVYCTANRNGKAYEISKTVYIHASATDLSISGESTIFPEGGGTYQYTVANPLGIDYDYAVVGAVSSSKTGDGITVEWGIGDDLSISVTGKPAGDSCSGVPIVFAVQKAPELSSSIRLIDGNQCLNSNVTYQLETDKYTSDLTWELSGGGVITGYDHGAGTVDVQWYNTPGSYALTAKYTRYGAREMILPVLLVAPDPEVAGDNVCEGSTALLKTKENYESYTWFDSKGAVISTGTQASVSKAGDYRVKVIDYHGCTGTGSFSLATIPKPKIKLVADPASFFYVKDTIEKVTLTLISDGNYSYTWDKDGEIFSVDGMSVEIEVDRSAEFTNKYYVEALSDQCSELIDLPISVQKKPVDPCEEPDLSFEVSGGCNAFNLTNTSELTDNCVWRFADGTTSKEISPSGIAFGEAESCRVTLKRGCRELSRSVNVPVRVSFTAEQAPCSLEVDFTDMSSIRADYVAKEWTWNFGDGSALLTASAGAIATKHEYANPGSYKVTITLLAEDADGNICSSVAEKTVNVTAVPVARFDVVAPACGSPTYALNNTSLYNGVADFMWSLGNTYATTLEHANVQYYTAGKRTVTLTVTDMAGCTSTASTEISAIDVSTIEDIAVNGNLFLCTGSTVELEAPLSSDGGYVWLKDGEVVAGQTGKTLIVDTEGDYAVVYETPSCAATTDVVRVKEFLAGVVPAVPEKACVGDYVELAYTGTLPSDQSSVWYFNGAVVPDSRNRIPAIEEVALQNAGDYVLKIMHNTYGCAMELPAQHLVVHDTPEKPALSLDKTAVCYGATVTGTYIDPLDNVQADWLVNNAVAGHGETADLVGLIKSNTYINLRVTDANGCQQLSDLANVNVSRKIEPDFHLDDTVEVCAGKTMKLSSGLNSYEFTFSWTLGDSTLPSVADQLQLFSIAVEDTGMYHVQATAKSSYLYVAGCTGYSQGVYVDLLPSYDSLEIAGPDSICTGETATLIANVPENLSWNTGDTVPEVFVRSAGTYTVEVIHPESGCVSRRVHTIKENPIPDLSFVPEGVYQRCSNLPLDLIGAEYYADYNWKMDGNMVADNSPLYVRKKGNYTLFAETEFGCSAESDTMRFRPIACYDSCIVTAVDDSVPGCLRYAIECANGKVGKDVILFKISGDGPFVITPEYPLPTITEAVAIDGFSQSGYGKHDVVLDGSLVPGNAFTFASGVERSEIMGLTFKNYQTPILVGKSASETIVEDNIFSAVENTAITFSDFCAQNVIIGNMFDTLSVAAVAFGDKSTRNIIRGNTVTHAPTGLLFSGETGQNTIEQNHFSNITGVAVHFMASAQKNTIEKNNVDTVAQGIYFADGSSNSFISKNTFVANERAVRLPSANVLSGNSFINSTEYAASVEGQHVWLTQNIFTNVNSQVPAITLVGTSNAEKKPAEFTEYHLTDDGLMLAGTSGAEDTVELFASSELPQQANAYIGYAVADTSGVWSFTITEGIYFNPDSRNYYTNTATKLRNTSELSDPFMVGCFNCVCTVTDTGDSGLHTLRAALDSAHSGACFAIEYDIAVPGDIHLDSALREITIPLAITGQDSIALRGSGCGFAIASQDVVLKNCWFANLDTAVYSSGMSTVLHGMHIAGGEIGVALAGDSAMIFGTSISGAETGVAIGGNNATVGSKEKPNVVTSASRAGIVVDAGIGNALLYNSVYENAEAIVLKNSGNNLYPAPFGLLGERTATVASIKGTAHAGDLIQVFVSSVESRQAKSFLFEAVVNADEFALSFPEQLLPDGKNMYVVLTATDSAGNTSELSDVVRLGNFGANCIVTNTADNGDGSLRAAIGCVNSAGNEGLLANVTFKLKPRDRTIVLGFSHFEAITNPYGVVIDGEDNNVVIDNGARLNYALRWSVPDVTVQNLTFSNFRNAIIAESSTVLTGNTFIDNIHALDLSGSGSSVVSDNTFSNNTIAIIAEDSLYCRRNVFDLAGTAGVYTSGNCVQVKECLFTNTQDGAKAIALDKKANNGIVAPSIDTAVATGNMLVLSGTAPVGSYIQLFVGTGLSQIATAYVGQVDAKTGGTWSYSIPEGEYYTSSAMNFYVATATIDRNTSELSEPYSAVCENCTCTVTTMSDSGEGSFREAVSRAHTGECRTIDFLLDLPADIMLDSGLQEITVPLAILGQDGISIQGPESDDLFVCRANGCSIIDLSFSGWNTVFDVAADSVVVSNITIANSEEPVKISGNNNRLSNFAIDGAIADAIAISGNNNAIGLPDGKNAIQNAGQSGVSVQFGTGNSVLFTAISRCHPAILHTEGGNNNYPAPTGFSTLLATDGASISGTAHAGDRIQVFTSSDIGGQAYEYVTEITTTNDAFTIEIPDDFVSQTQNSYFVLTATSKAGSTSPLSKVATVGSFDVVCPVTVTEDKGAGSLRDAIGCVNRAGYIGAKAIVAFDLQGEKNTIELKTELDSITNIYGVDIINKTGNVVSVQAENLLRYGLKWNVPFIRVRNLDFQKFAVAIDGKASAAEVDSNSFAQCGTAIRLKGNGSAWVRRNAVVSSNNGFSLQGKSIQVSGNDIQADTAIALLGAQSPVVQSNSLSNGSVAVLVDRSTVSASIVDNTVSGIDGNALSIFGASASVRTNYFNAIGMSAILLSGANSADVRGNSIGFGPAHDTSPVAGNALRIVKSSNVSIAENMIGGTHKDAVVIEESAYVSLLKNYLGTDKNGMVHPLHASAIIADVASIEENTISNAVGTAVVLTDNSTVAENIFRQNKGGAISVLGQNVQIHRNRFVNDFTPALAISLATGANANKKPPVTEKYRRTENGIRLTGMATAGDTVELFTSTLRPQQALAYVGYAVADSEGAWQYEIGEG